MPIINLARYSRGQDLTDDWAFYPLYSNIEGKAAAFLELPLQWYGLRPTETFLSNQLSQDIRLGRVFENCAETVNLFSYDQLRRLGSAPVMDLFMERQGNILPSDLPVDLTEWTGLQPDLPGHLADVVRDMRAGLDTAVAVRRLKTLYSEE